ncbi:U4/U6 small nuclear ribonucleoprotein PRP31 [Monocercomonoides exilis]|uniref:U4/U6 small nuclear ribonucleoprotein PRP31 n=1 Tax=Monocercomonoides exilis TaxID=2049356 RepID=UPI00355A93C2|nr:U4/U6 small nuclear ribonucleoprotein PRP31 [Monocercomonoides exilis]|eukprot:MONOS_8508.1-p1 / transcript=MONOS_8508.1 / gene=MONOS_8508 / organism=Monocercomonoides_exilis_PA203 / gene_product=U4/U6 small nuclear ribonucleoprotein PRP31 / transcript_product=U4/U6 small nuclear ribonucleoprotein PRP31 / location=Mono_scaffold00322:51112-54140(+) / protein_length=872 / sequence_SO=supercontig / SO=protein_coding / is_pseudo=false
MSALDDLEQVEEKFQSVITSINEIPSLLKNTNFCAHIDVIRQQIHLGRPINMNEKLLRDEYDLFAQSNYFVENIEDEVRQLHGVISGLYHPKFPELDGIVTNPFDYAKVCKAIGNSTTFEISQLNLVIPPQVAMSLKLTSSLSSSPLQQSIFEEVIEGCDRILELESLRSILVQFVESRIQFIAPNTSRLVGAGVAAKLVASAGGLDKMAKMTSRDILYCGVSVKTTTIGTKVGFLKGSFITQCELVRSTPKTLREKATQMLSGRVSLCSRIDAAGQCPSGSWGQDYKDELEAKIDKLLEPPPIKEEKPRPLPPTQRKKRRGGVRVRKMKERYRVTDIRKAQNKIMFGEEEEEVGLTGHSFGSLVQKGSGVGFVKIQTKGLDYKLSKKAQKQFGFKKKETSGFQTELGLTPSFIPLASSASSTTPQPTTNIPTEKIRLMTTSKPDEQKITDLEAAIYDRQIRIWGLDAQTVLRKSRILAIGVSGLCIETCKNLCLAGVNSIALWDDREVSESCSSANFFFSENDLHKNRAVVYSPKFHEMNSFCSFYPITTSILNWALTPKNEIDPKTKLSDFQIVLCLDQSPEVALALSQQCRSLKIPMIFAESRLDKGFFFSDLGSSFEYGEAKVAAEIIEKRKIAEESAEIIDDDSEEVTSDLPKPVKRLLSEQPLAKKEHSEGLHDVDFDTKEEKEEDDDDDDIEVIIQPKRLRKENEPSKDNSKQDASASISINASGRKEAHFTSYETSWLLNEAIPRQSTQSSQRRRKEWMEQAQKCIDAFRREHTLHLIKKKLIEPAKYCIKEEDKQSCTASSGKMDSSEQAHPQELDFSPTCSVVGGVLAQEAINAITHRNPPLNNTFYYDCSLATGGIVLQL